MNHTVTIVKTKQLSDGEFAILSQCCGDPTTNSWGTMAAATSSDPTKCQAFIDFHHNRIAGLHSLAIQSRAALANLVGTTATITVPDPTPAPVSSPDPAPAAPVSGAPSTPDPSTSPSA